ncbi:glycosyltransferase family 2 protein [Cyanobium sp. AMD-g]|uniref:glycosyltransferase n=1 Tax=Cyanobium sp. AMD-g TaxID=2823699 RepID=UPI0020CB8E6C|nr:glycosyltransferase [Cyanobium sp. AMD-g]MCP9929775.1 glycosyltransferase family 2 protein [Cyanobium sp. AMD-g]
MSLSVIIFTYNPRKDYLLRVLDALRNQTLSLNEWELILVDNASDDVLSSTYDLGWHPHGRHVREDKLGLTLARLRGIREARGDLLVFVDDDNVLHPDYLENVLIIAHHFPFLGSFGGQVHAIYESAPHPDVEAFLYYLLDTRLTKARWGQDEDYHRFSPSGAGMAVRRKVAERYIEKLKSDPRRIGLGRRGAQLFAGEDKDLAFCSHDMRMGNGLFPELILDHLIPSSRLQPEFFVRVAKAGSFSNVILRYLNGVDYLEKPITLAQLAKRGLKRLVSSSLAKKIDSACALGRMDALDKIQEWERT